MNKYADLLAVLEERCAPPIYEECVEELRRAARKGRVLSVASVFNQVSKRHRGTAHSKSVKFVT